VLRLRRQYENGYIFVDKCPKASARLRALFYRCEALPAPRLKPVGGADTPPPPTTRRGASPRCKKTKTENENPNRSARRVRRRSRTGDRRGGANRKDWAKILLQFASWYEWAIANAILCSTIAFKETTVKFLEPKELQCLLETAFFRVRGVVPFTAISAYPQLS
jgi:hypothetical protein